MKKLLLALVSLCLLASCATPATSSAPSVGGSPAAPSVNSEAPSSAPSVPTAEDDNSAVGENAVYYTAGPNGTDATPLVEGDSFLGFTLTKQEFELLDGAEEQTEYNSVYATFTGTVTLRGHLQVAPAGTQEYHHQIGFFPEEADAEKLPVALNTWGNTQNEMEFTIADEDQEAFFALTGIDPEVGTATEEDMKKGPEWSSRVYCEITISAYHVNYLNSSDTMDWAAVTAYSAL